jgi:bifunctional oligoribonuclease and PAP phosphatase NrnA
MQKNIPLIKEKILSASQIAIFGHEHVDGDALGAMLGLGTVLESLGKEIFYFTPHAPSKIFDFLDLGDKVQTDFDYGKYDLLIFLDFNGYPRISGFTAAHEEYFDSQEKIIIDHHQPEPLPENTLIYRDIWSISTCSIIYQLLNIWRPKLITPQVATYLYMGISTDSGNFRYDEGEQSIQTFETVVALLKLFRKKSYRSIQFMQQVLSRMQKRKYSFEGKEISMIYSYYVDSELEEYEVDHDEADYALNIMQDIRYNDLVILIKKVWNFVKFSLRGRGEIDCSALARSLGGGGHFNAAGIKLQSSGYLEKDIDTFLKQLDQYFA